MLVLQLSLSTRAPRCGNLLLDRLCAAITVHHLTIIISSLSVTVTAGDPQRPMSAIMQRCPSALITPQIRQPGVQFQVFPIVTSEQSCNWVLNGSQAVYRIVSNPSFGICINRQRSIVEKLIEFIYIILLVEKI